ncbi:MAG: response regulator [Aridibacter famidurans]|nr:response regulator [Aridibacter famidurans]
MQTIDSSKPEARPPLVFVIEDDDIQRRGLSRFLKREGFNVREFADGESALEDAHSGRDGPDLVVCDYKLPGRNGLEVMKEMGAGRGTGFILISAYLTDALNSEARTAGFSSALEKPVSLELLLKKCKAAMGSGQRTDAARGFPEQDK